MASGDGVPRRSVIRSSWWTTFFPGKRGFPVKSSENMQPMLHMSIAGVYWKTKVHDKIYLITPTSDNKTLRQTDGDIIHFHFTNINLTL